MCSSTSYFQYNAVNFLYIQYVYQFTCTKQKAPGNRLFHKSLLNYGSLVWNLLRITLLTSKILKRLLDFWKICQSLSCTFHTLHLYRVGEKSLYNKQGVSHNNDKTKFPANGSHTCTIFNNVAIALLSLCITVFVVLCKLKIILCAYCVGVQRLITQMINIVHGTCSYCSLEGSEVYM